MALITCPECNNNVSDKAYCCPHCGFPVNDKKQNKIKRKSSERKRLPNGFGSITEIKNKNLREPFYVRITVGKNEYGKPILKPLRPKTYYATYNEAYTALINYHANPYQIESCCTLSQLYDKWSDSYFKELKNDSAARGIKSAWSYLDEQIKHQEVTTLDILTLRKSITNAKKINDKGELTLASPNIQSRMKSMFNLMFDYAVEGKLMQVNISRQFSLKGIEGKIEKNRKVKNIISAEHEQILWDNLEYGCTRMILINIYSGWRPDELVKLRRADVDFDKMIITGGEKTDAGTNRHVPIHPKVLDLIKYYYDRTEGYEHLFFDAKYDYHASLTYDKYRKRFTDVMQRYSWDDYSPSCPRHTFATKAKNAEVNDIAIKLIMGHEIKDVTEKHYTHRDNDAWVLEEVKKMK